MKSDSEIERLRFHDLRHTFGSLAARGGMDVTWIQHTMGHASFKTTSRYLHHRPATDEAKKLTRAFGGVAADSIEPERESNDAHNVVTS